MGMEITSEISDYLHKRLSSIEKFLPTNEGSFIVDVELGRTTNHHNTGDVFRAEINLFIGGKTFRAVSEQIDLHSAIDDMKDEVTRELSSFKEKRISIVRRAGQKFKGLFKRFYQ